MFINIPRGAYWLCRLPVLQCLLRAAADEQCVVVLPVSPASLPRSPSRSTYRAESPFCGQKQSETRAEHASE